MSTFFAGSEYYNFIWSQAVASLAWYQAIPYGANSPSNALLINETLTNAANAIQTAAFVQACQNQTIDLTDVLGLPIILGTGVSAVVNRLDSLQQLSSDLIALLPQPPLPAASSLLNMGQAGVPGSDYIAYYAGYSGETSPDYSVSGMYANATQWESVVTSLQTFYGANPTQLLDTVTLISDACTMQSNILFNFAPQISASGFPSAPGIPLGEFIIGESYVGLGQSSFYQTTYNQIYSLPSTFFACNVNSQNMGSFTAQQALVAAYALRTLASQFQNTIMIASTPQTQAPINTTVVMGNETLQEVAARTLGSFEGWETLAMINGIIPGNSPPAGTQLFLPPIGPSGQTALSYNVNVLGRDMNIGPTNGVMPPWNGDFQTIIGLNNLIYALGRRLQTTLGSLVFHTDYGSRIPPEVGAVQTLQTAQQINAFGKSCLLSDPRVAQVSQIQTTSGTGYGVIQLNATVIAIGPASNQVQLNEVLSPV